MTRKFLVKVHYRAAGEDFRLSQIIDADDPIEATDLLLKRFNLSRAFIVVLNVGPEDKP
jgi:hypothetical protein